MIPANHTRRWMLVDDDEGVLAFMREIIAQFGGIEAECYHSPFQALAAFAADPKGYELVITDLEMPDMNGIEFGHRLLELKPEAKILLSTGSSAITEKTAIGEGFRGVLHKPVPVTEISRVLQDMGLTPISHPK
jgi:two-component system cell cycle sensor histidine kinase/response regulator CckA